MLRIFLICLLLPVGAAAAPSSVFKYQAADGSWHYTDQRPASGRVQQLALAAPEKTSSAAPTTVLVEQRGTTEAPEFFAVNHNAAPVEVKFWLTEAVNLLQAADQPTHMVVPARSARRIAALTPRVVGRPSRYRYKYRWQLGDPTARHNDGYRYLAPVPADGEFFISQAFDGDFSHNSPASRHAIDIPMREGSAVRAARGGKVVTVRMGSKVGGNSPRYRPHANAIYIQHEDGTYAVYAHLRHRSALVTTGAEVAAGQIIAQSGNTGFSTAPHLHFAVLRNGGMGWLSVPFVLDVAGAPVAPSRGLALNGAADTETLAATVAPASLPEVGNGVGQPGSEAGLR